MFICSSCRPILHLFVFIDAWTILILWDELDTMSLKISILLLALQIQSINALTNQLPLTMSTDYFYLEFLSVETFDYLSICFYRWSHRFGWTLTIFRFCTSQLDFDCPSTYEPIGRTPMTFTQTVFSVNLWQIWPLVDFRSCQITSISFSKKITPQHSLTCCFLCRFQETMKLPFNLTRLWGPFHFYTKWTFLYSLT